MLLSSKQFFWCQPASRPAGTKKIVCCSAQQQPFPHFLYASSFVASSRCMVIAEVGRGCWCVLLSPTTTFPTLPVCKLICGLVQVHGDSRIVALKLRSPEFVTSVQERAEPAKVVILIFFYFCWSQVSDPNQPQV